MEDNPFEIDQTAFANEEEMEAQAKKEAEELLAQGALGGDDDDDNIGGGANTLSGDASALGNGLEGLIPICVQHAIKSAPQLNGRVFGYDIAQMESKPWQKPDANLSDYFNYGFNEQSWRVYCAMQQQGPNSVLLRAEDYAEVVQTKGGAAQPPVGGGYGSAGGAGGGGAQVVMPKDHMYGGAGASGGGGAPGGGGFGAGGGGGGGEGPSMPQRGALWKTRPCYNFRNGTCTKGDNCNYAHGDHELRQPPPGMLPMGGSAGGAPVGGGMPMMGGSGGGNVAGPSGGLAPPPQPPMPPPAPGQGPPVVAASSSSGVMPTPPPGGLPGTSGGIGGDAGLVAPPTAPGAPVMPLPPPLPTSYRAGGPPPQGPGNGYNPTGEEPPNKRARFQ